MSTPTGTGLTPELIDRVMQLSPEDKDRLADMLTGETCRPDDRTDAEIAAMIKQRSDDVRAGKVKLLTAEEVEENLRQSLRRDFGIEL